MAENQQNKSTYEKSPTESQETVNNVAAVEKPWTLHGSPVIKALLGMLSLLVLGTLAAVGQHLFYSYVNGKHVTDVKISQDWVIRVGTAFAFLFQTVLVTAIAAAYRHRFWFSI